MESEEIRLAGVVRESIVDGPGIRYTVFTQGCPHHCPGCHNPETHDFNGGYVDTVENIFNDFKRNPLLTGITFSGGEPMCQPKPLFSLAERVAGIGKDIVIYSGYTFEQLTKMSEEKPEIRKLLLLCRMLIDGPYIESKRDLSLNFRGSSNQRLIENPLR